MHSIAIHVYTAHEYTCICWSVQDGLRLLIQVANHGEYELDANTLDEKNKVYIHVIIM